MVDHLAPLLYVSPTQINFQIPPGTNTGEATVIVTSAGGRVATGTIHIAASVPSLFTANSDGKGVAAAIAVRVKADGSQSVEPVEQFDGTKFVSRPIDLGPPSEQVFLVLFGTGIRYRNALSAVAVQLGGIDAQIDYAGAQGYYIGLDQINVRVPRSLSGRGEIAVTLAVEAGTANTVQVNIK